MVTAYNSWKSKINYLKILEYHTFPSFSAMPPCTPGRILCSSIIIAFLMASTSGNQVLLMIPLILGEKKNNTGLGQVSREIALVWHVHKENLLSRNDRAMENPFKSTWGHSREGWESMLDLRGIISKGKSCRHKFFVIFVFLFWDTSYIFIYSVFDWGSFCKNYFISAGDE